MKKFLLVLVIMVIGSCIASALCNALGLEASSEVIGDRAAGIAFLLIYVLWGAAFCMLAEDIWKNSD